MHRHVWWFIKAKLLLQKIVISKLNFFHIYYISMLKSKLNLDNIHFKINFQKEFLFLFFFFFSFHFWKTFSVSNPIPWAKILFNMWPSSATTDIIHSLFISFIHALNHLPWISGLCNILVTINATLAHKFEQRCIRKPAEYVRSSFLSKSLLSYWKLLTFTKISVLDFYNALNATLFN